MSFVSRTNVVSFLFHMIISSEVAFELPVKQSGGWGWMVVLWVMCCLIFPFSFQIYKGPRQHSWIIWETVCTFLMEGCCVCGASKSIEKKQANLKVVQILLKYVSHHLIPCVALAKRVFVTSQVYTSSLRTEIHLGSWAWCRSYTFTRWAWGHLDYFVFLMSGPPESCLQPFLLPPTTTL